MTFLRMCPRCQRFTEPCASSPCGLTKQDRIQLFGMSSLRHSPTTPGRVVFKVRI